VKENVKNKKNINNFVKNKKNYLYKMKFNKKCGMCAVALTALFLALCPGFLVNIPAHPDDEHKLGEFVSYAGFKHWRQTLFHGAVYLVVAYVICANMKR
jgi:hypothetical protein